MAFDPNDEILQDFLIEAGEIIELLDGQLVDLEKQPDDNELLNAIFRGFHTVKGGAGFLGIESMVKLCHCAEDIFNMLRQGDLRVTQELMDSILIVHDTLTSMFESLKLGIEPKDAEQSLLDDLKKICNASNDETQDTADQGDGDEDITDDEFEDLLDKMHGTSQVADEAVDSTNKATELPSDSDDITDKEFEVLLDVMHGSDITANNNKSTTIDSTQNSPKISDSIETKSNTNSSVDDVEKLKPVVVKNSVKEDKNNNNNKQPEKVKNAVATETTVRVDTKRLDDIMNLVGELVLVRNRLTTLGLASNSEEMTLAVTNLDLVTSDLQTAVMKTRMQPIKKVFGRFPRIVRDLARSLNKDIELVMIGEDTDLDKNLVEALADPLVHLVRNSVDHGIEMPDVREAAGKPRKGIITLSAKQEGENILLSIIDDGAGMDAELLKNIAVKKGVMDRETADRLTNEESYSLIFMPGFSTKEEISEISGRGVGMDVVKTKITDLNGSIIIKSELGSGSRIDIKVPLTLAIMPTLMVLIGNQIYALPLASVVEIFNYDDSMVKTVDGQEVILIRNKPLPIYHLNKWLSNSNTSAIGKRVVVVNASGKTFGFVVEKLLGQEEVVIKPLGTLLHGIKGMSGATITGDGKISLILDVPGLMRKYANGI